MRFLRRWATTSSRVGRSTVPVCSCPCAVLAVYSKLGIETPYPRLALRRERRGLPVLRRAPRLVVVRHPLGDHPPEILLVGRRPQTLPPRALPPHETTG